MTIKAPSASQISEVGAQLGMRLSEGDAAEYLAAMAPLIDAYNTVDAMADELPPVRYPRVPGHRPEGDENPHNAWYWKTSIAGAPDGKLAGKKVAIKDNICVAGVPMMNGASVLEGYVPDVDATIVTRILDAGGEIAGKTACEYLCFSGGSHTNATGLPVHNPWKRGYTTGGSSSGSGAVVAAGDVEMAIGCDQAGSVRIPASMCGIVGLKPTHGLVPYSGVAGIEATIDHAGPMTDTVANNALLLEVIAGFDGLDPRQIGVPDGIAYTDALSGGASGLTVGVLKEGYGHPNSEPDVDEKVRAAVAQLEAAGATVREISIPEHLVGVAVWTPVGVEGTVDLLNGNGSNTNAKGLHVTSLLDRLSLWHQRADELSDSLKYVILLGQYMLNQYGGRYYAKAQNIVRRIGAAYDRALQECDVIVMPTLPIKATPIPPADAPKSLVIQRAHEMFANTAVFDVTGHPALTIPCGLSDGLPVGLMLVGKQFDEATIYRAANAYEQSVDWKSQ
jgi:amidase